MLKIIKAITKVDVLFFVFLSTILGLYLSGCVSLKGLTLNSLSTTETFTVPMEFELSNKKEWDNLGDKIISSRSKYITLEIQGWGGSNDVLYSFLRKIQTAQQEGKILTGVIVGGAYSCHALLSCYMNKVVFTSDTSQLLFHYTRYMDNKGNFAGWPTKLSIISQVNPLYRQCIRAGLITESDMMIVVVEHKRVIVNNKRSFIEDDEI